MSKEATYRLACRFTFRCPCKRQLEKRYPWETVICVCGNVWGEEDEDRVRREKRRRTR